LAAHTIDIQFLFRNWHGGVLGFNHPAELSPQESALSDELVAAWTNFTATGNPNGKGNSPWPKYTDAAGAPARNTANVTALSTINLAHLSATNQWRIWTGNTLNGGILRFQP